MPSPSPSSSSVRTLDLSDLECSICLRLLLEPVTLSCGHTLCRSCLARSLNVKRQCPFCRHPCSLNPVTHPSTTVLAQLLGKYFADESAARAAAAAADGDDLARDRASGPRRLPLLFTRAVEFPNRNVQYVVHEPRYQRLVSDCLAGKREFVAVLDGSDIGCLMTIVDARAALDGRRLIQCRGLQAVRIGDQRDVEMGFGLRSAVVSPVVDVPGSGAGTADLLAACHAAIDRAMEASSGALAARLYDLDNAVAPEGPSEFSYWAFGLVQCPVALKLAALSEPDIGQRLHLLMQAVDEWRRRMRRRNWNQTLMFGAVIAFTIAFSVKEHLSSK